MSQVGMDIERARGIASQLEADAKMLRASSDAIQRVVAEAQRSWRGVDAVSFADAWHRHRAELIAAEMMLAELAKLLLSNAAEQDAVSGARGEHLSRRRRSGDRRGSASSLDDLARQMAWITTVAAVPSKLGKLSRYGSILASAYREVGWSGNMGAALKLASRGERAWVRGVLGDGLDLFSKNEGHLVASLSERFPGAAEFIGGGAASLKGAGTAAGAFGAVYSGFSAYEAYKRGDTEEAIVNSVSAVGGALMLCPPPADAVGGVLTAGVMIYENREAILNGIDAVGRAELAVLHGMGKAASSVASTASKTLSHLNPFD